jgi:hypothetical protein
MTDPTSVLGALPVAIAGLPAADRAALARNGFVSAERRTTGATTYKLRRRAGGRQHVRYLGSDGEAAARAAAAVAALQAPRKRARDLARAVAAARAELRRVRAAAGPALAEIGYQYHGLAIRRARPPAPESTQPTAPNPQSQDD